MKFFSNKAYFLSGDDCVYVSTYEGVTKIREKKMRHRNKVAVILTVVTMLLPTIGFGVESADGDGPDRQEMTLRQAMGKHVLRIDTSGIENSDVVRFATDLARLTVGQQKALKAELVLASHIKDPKTRMEKIIVALREFGGTVLPGPDVYRNSEPSGVNGPDKTSEGPDRKNPSSKVSCSLLWDFIDLTIEW